MISDIVEWQDRAKFMAEAHQQISQRLQGQVPEDLQQFIELFFHQYPINEFNGRAWQDVFGCVYGLWQFIQKHDKRTAKIKVFNPDLEEDAWLSSHTVVAVLQQDMPFLVDSIRMEFNRRNIAVHTVKSTLVKIQRDSKHQIKNISFPNTDSNKAAIKEALLFFEIDLHTDEKELKDIRSSLQDIIRQVETVVHSYADLSRQVSKTIESLESARSLNKHPNFEPTVDFMKWMQDGHFTFLGYCEYDLINEGEQSVLEENVDKRLGSISLTKEPPRRLEVDARYPGLIDFHSAEHLLVFAKSSERSQVHRSAYPDYVVVKRFDSQGEVCGESRFLGLYTSSVYSESPMSIPIIRDKVNYVLKKSGLDGSSHDGKLLRLILDTFPRDELFQNSDEQLYELATKVTQINERHRVRLFLRRGPYGKFVNGLVYVPRDLFNTEIRLKIQNIIGEAVGATEEQFTTYFSESILARVHLVFQVDPNNPTEWDENQLEQRVVNVIRSWEDHLRVVLTEGLGEEQGVRYLHQFKNAFPTAYREQYDVRAAMHDIQSVLSLNGSNDIAMSFYQPLGQDDHIVRFKVFRRNAAIELSDVIPVLENLGLRVIGEQPHKIHRNVEGNIEKTWMHDFELVYSLPVVIDVHAARNYFQDAFAAVWHNQADNDEFNRLVLGARLNWREVALLRAYAAYMKQTLFNFSQSSIAMALANHLNITRNLIAMFKGFFDPRVNQDTSQDRARIKRLTKKIEESLEGVDNLNEDRILRRYLELIGATVRTNFFQPDQNGNTKYYISLKFLPREIEGIPEPRPQFEIFVYSPRVEGVHLRGGPVARGGLRWSDRLEDYRTEVLGLVKAQQVKNSVIVPDGAKGGFVAKQLLPSFSRDEFLAEGIESYKIFISGLLDLTDNLVENAVQAPEQVIRRDGDDPYMVVAADKGTATFSDIANSLSLKYKHWLGDAFASGGSQGYDHKGMGITARGAWVSVQRHFREVGIDIQKQDFTVIGVGDMAGDVFGNGMLLSEHICLVAAFNHQHIFLDPNPDAAKSFEERQRLFDLPKSSWEDYHSELISKGGGLYSRSAKSISITPEVAARFDIKDKQLNPTALINALLKAPIDLLWNGGIGTYVKASTETHAQVGDKANDSLRVDAKELRCRVIGEGGNLGITQLARVEFALHGGACNTDFIDNAAGVDCSDHEVNIKILLNELVVSGDLTEKQRNRQLADMTDEVADLVLLNNYQQTQAISIAQFQSLQRMGEYRRLISALESEGRLKRHLEFIPSDEELNERSSNSQALTRPELAILMAYTKVKLKQAYSDSDLTDDPYINQMVEEPFPKVLVKKYREPLYQHRLRKEIVATQLANDIVNSLGITFVQRLTESTGSSPVAVAKAYVAARDIYQLREFRQGVEALDSKIPSELQLSLLSSMMRRVRRATRWFLRNRRSSISVEEEINQFRPVIEQISAALPNVLRGQARVDWDAEYNRLIDANIPENLAKTIAMPSNLYSGLGMVAAAMESGTNAVRAAEVFYVLGDKIQLHWFSNQISDVSVGSYWQAMARESFMDDLESQMRTLAVALIRLAGSDMDIENAVENWMQQFPDLTLRWRSMIAELQAAPGTDFAMFSVALRELLDLAQTAQHCESLEVISSESTGS